MICKWFSFKTVPQFSVFSPHVALDATQIRVYPDDTSTARELIEAARQQLYKPKRTENRQATLAQARFPLLPLFFCERAWTNGHGVVYRSYVAESVRGVSPLRGAT